MIHCTTPSIKHSLIVLYEEKAAFIDKKKRNSQIAVPLFRCPDKISFHDLPFSCHLRQVEVARHLFTMSNYQHYAHDGKLCIKKQVPDIPDISHPPLFTIMVAKNAEKSSKKPRKTQKSQKTQK
jgi:hypothetical protein